MSASLLKVGDSSEIGETNVALAEQENVFEFEIAVKDLADVEVIKGEDDFGEVECGLVLEEDSLPSKLEEELPTSKEVHDDGDFWCKVIKSNSICRLVPEFYVF